MTTPNIDPPMDMGPPASSMVPSMTPSFIEAAFSAVPTITTESPTVNATVSASPTVNATFASSESPTWNESMSYDDSASPSISPSDESPSHPTVRPTPSSPFPYRAEGDSSFGHQWQDEYNLAHQHAFRRPGWSYGDPSSGSSPFCYRNLCYNITEACDTFGGELLHSSVCSFPEDVKISGPSCWRGACTAAGYTQCREIGGVHVGEPDGSGGPQWCVFNGAHSMLGPMCYGRECYETEALEACNEVEGTIWNSNYCFVEGYHTPIGPICWNGHCIVGDAQNKCQDLGGTVFAKRWCLLSGCDRTVIGPTCSMAPSSFEQQCFQDETVKVCRRLGGTQIANRFCVLDGTDWTFIGPTVYEKTETIGQTNDFCRELKQSTTNFFNFMDSYEIAGRFCLVNERIPTTTPFCTDSGCNITMGKKFCERFNGKTLAGGFMCSLCDSFRQVVGPLSWNGTLLEGNPKYCEGAFCAIPRRAKDSTENARCPNAEPVIGRCGSFGGAVGVPGEANDVFTGEDDDGNGDPSESPGGDDNNNNGASSGSMQSRRVTALVVYASLFWMVHSVRSLGSY